MNKKRFSLMLLLTILITIVGFFVIGKKNMLLVSPVLQQPVSMQNISTKPIPTSQPTVFNKPPEEIRYDSQTDLNKELDSINPQIIDSDFESD